MVRLNGIESKTWLKSIADVVAQHTIFLSVVRMRSVVASVNRVCNVRGCQTRLSRCDGRKRLKCARCCRLKRESRPKAMQSLHSRVQSHQPQIPM